MLRSQNIHINTPLDYCSNELTAIPLNEIREQTCKNNVFNLSTILSAANCDINNNVNQIIEAFKDLKDNVGWFAISNLTSYHSNPTEATKNIFRSLKLILSSIRASLTDDLVSVVVLVSDMSQYAEINKEYLRHFSLNPPVRVCVQCAIDVPLTISVVGFKRKDESEKLNNDDSLESLNNERHVMHVQSVSHWAAANIGPYSQAVEVNGILHIAGLIGLVSGSMELVSGKGLNL